VGALTENWLAGFRVVDDGRTSVANYVWDTGSLAWVVQTGGGAGPSADVNIIGSITLSVTGPLTDTQLRASAVPVSGTFFQATQPVSAVSLPLPTGASTEATLAALSAKFSALGQTTMALSAPVVIASNQSAIPVTLTSTTITGSVAVTGPLTDAQLRATPVPVSLTSTTITGSVAVTGPLTDAQLRASAVPVSLASTTITGSVAVTGPLTDAQLRATPVPTKELRATVNTRSSVAGAAVDTVILTSNVNRLGATVYNDSSAVLYLALGTAAASTSDYTVQMVSGAYYEVPFAYTGGIRGIWASATGNARVGEIT